MALCQQVPNVSYKRLASVTKDAISENHQVLPYSMQNIALCHEAPNVSYERLASVAKNGVSEDH